MSNIYIDKKDLIWSYIAKLLSVISGFVTLPLILSMLSAEEIGLNYVMMTISSLIALLDFGFSPQFGRNFAYVNSGARRLLKVGVEYSDAREIDYHLLSVLLQTAKYVYRRLSLISVFIMFTIGTLYIYIVTEGFTSVKYSLSIWMLFSISTYFNVYFNYYNSLLIGSGKVAEANIAIILSRLFYLFVVTILLILGLGLFAVVIGNLVLPLISSVYSYRKYFTKDLVVKLDFNIDKSEIKDLFSIVWFNSKKLGINFLGSYAINKSGLFLVGLFIPLSVVGSYGLLIQLATLLVSVSLIPFITFQPKFANLRIINDRESFKSLMGITTVIYFLCMIIGSVVILCFGQDVLSLMNSNTVLPSKLICTIYLLAITLEGNYSIFATLIVTDNKVPFVSATIISGLLIVGLTVLLLMFTDWNLLGVVIVPFIVQLSFNNWYWPHWVLKSYKITMYEVVKLGFSSIVNIIKRKLYRCR